MRRTWCGPERAEAGDYTAGAFRPQDMALTARGSAAKGRKKICWDAVPTGGHKSAKEKSAQLPMHARGIVTRMGRNAAQPSDEHAVRGASA